jgi:hypothetical protein
MGQGVEKSIQRQAAGFDGVQEDTPGTAAVIGGGCSSRELMRPGR